MRVWRNSKVKAQRLTCTAELCISAHECVGNSTQSQQDPKIPWHYCCMTQGFMRPLVSMAIATGLKFCNKTPGHIVSSMIDFAHIQRGVVAILGPNARGYHATGVD